MYLVLNLFLNWFVFEFHHLTFYFYIKYNFYYFDCYFLLFLFFSRLKLFFNFISYNLILFYFCVKFGSFFLNLNFLNYFFLIYFFSILSLIILEILHCYFSRLDFYAIIRSHDPCYKILKVKPGWLQLFFIIFLKFHSSSLSSLKIGILCFFGFGFIY
jgi:hypothetical protein